MGHHEPTARHFDGHALKQPSFPLRIGGHLSRLLFALGALLLSLALWLANTWSELSPDEILFHLRASLAGTDTTVIWNYCLFYLSVVLMSFAAVAFCHWRLRRSSLKSFRNAVVATAVAGIALGGGALFKFSSMIDLGAYLSGEDSEGGFIAEQYVNPSSTAIEFPERKRNLIYIYLESMELTFADSGNGGAWNENLIPELCILGHEGDTFNGDSEALSGGYVLPGTAWTMGAMFGQSSGVPLKLPFLGNFIEDEMTDFFPDLVTIGDILEDEGYSQYLMLGSDANFGSRASFYLEHGNYEMYDYVRAKEDGFIDPDYHVFWGMEDQKLFAWAKQLLPELAAKDEPFNLTMLTVDTHFEDGYVCDLCKSEHGDNQYANVMSCSSRQVYDFVRWIQQQDFYENTTIVICGDHTTMDKDFCKEVSKDYPRRTFTTILNSTVSCEDPTAYRTYSTLDLFPTTLASLGAKIDGNRLGLGVNLYAEEPTILEEFGVEDCTSKLQRMSLFLDQFSSSSLSDTMIENTLAECVLMYDDGTLGFGGFLLGDMYLIDPTLIESSRLTYVDDRTKKEIELPMIQWSSDEQYAHHATLDLSHYYLGAHLDLSEDDLPHITATAYVTVKGYDEQVFGTWTQETATTRAEAQKKHEKEYLAEKKAEEEAAAAETESGEGITADTPTN